MTSECNSKYTKILEDNGFFFASNDDQFQWAKNHPDLIPLESVVKKVSNCRVSSAFFCAFFFL